LQQGTATRTSQASISAALAAATANAVARVPSPTVGSSLAEIAQRDLDAALQLLADRAQYITGSSGVAIALRRSGKRDMLCRASAGSNAPELGALLSTEFGLSGESVRTRQLLRCDDVERDLRVNREACRRLGIASVAVMPVVNDDEVLGVFELFSGRVNAFAERDLTALKRLSEMVETAVKLARAAEQVTEQLLETDLASAHEARASSVNLSTEVEDPVVEVEAEFVADAVLPTEVPVAKFSECQPPSESLAHENVSELLSPDPPRVEADAERASAPKPIPGNPNRPLLWSIALDPISRAGMAQPGQGRVPATLRNLGKCQACGFPVSPGRALCVECEEKKWRGQLRPSGTRSASTGAAAAAAAAPAPEPADDAVPKDSKVASLTAKELAKPAKPMPGKQGSAGAYSEEPGGASLHRQTTAGQPELVLTAAMEPSQSWISAHKFIIFVLLAAGAGAAVLLLH
jgi:GAF domain